MESLSVWICDMCGGDVRLDGKGLVIARPEPTTHNPYSWKIVHKITCDPESRSGYLFNYNLEDLVGLEGQARLLSLLSLGPLKGAGRSPRLVSDFAEFVDLFRRLQTPFYEQARQHFDDPEVQAEYSDSNEYHPYLPEILKKIADR